jgi:hypothetical protein
MRWLRLPAASSPNVATLVLSRLDFVEAHATTDRRGYLERRLWRDESLELDVPWVPTMLSPHERRLLYLLARDFAEDDAAIVDAGCFLGGSTVALLAGVRDRQEPWRGEPIASYDRFRVEEYTIPKFFRDDPAIRAGDSFRERFDSNVAGFDVPHVVHEGDITEIGWSGGPIDVLFLDVLKTWEINDAVLRDFFPSLIPGRSVIVHQDYGWGWLPWIPITVELMRDSVGLIDGMRYGSHVFLLERNVPVELIANGTKGLDLATKIEAVERVIERSEGAIRGMMEIARTPLLAERDGREAARRDLERIDERYGHHPSVALCVSYSRVELEHLPLPADD